jgi:phosphohistidine phosphatase
MRETVRPMVRTLHLLRHAKSSWKDPELPDHDRPLSKRGRRSAGVLAHHFAHLNSPDLVLCSTALRTRQTLELISAALKPPKVVLDRAIYGGGARKLMKLLWNLPDTANTVLLVGHNPALHQLALSLADDRSARRLPPIDDKFPTAALVTFQFTGKWSELHPGKAVVIAYVSPTDLDDEDNE